jgi:hypothetical protein
LLVETENLMQSGRYVKREALHESGARLRDPGADAAQEALLEDRRDRTRSRPPPG